MTESVASRRWARLVLLAILVAGLVQVQVPLAFSSHGPLVVPSPQYPTIQSAVDDAHAGDTVLVSPGTYSENVVVTRSVSLVGASRDTTVIDAGGSGPGVNITGASAVLVSGFTVLDSGFYNGVEVSGSSNVTIYGNRVQAGPQVYGVYVFSSTSVRLIGNEFAGNIHGVRIQSGGSNLVQANNATGNTLGVSVFLSAGNKIVDNVLQLGETGLWLGDGSVATVVARNRIANNTVFGINLIDSGGHFIVDNAIENNTSTPPAIPAEGVNLQNSTLNTFHHNNLRFNDVQVFAVRNPGDITGSVWNDGSQGNFWGDYSGLDDGSGGRPAGDGVGDTLIPHPCPLGGQPCSAFGPAGVDNYPLMSRVLLPSWNVTATARPLSGLALLSVSFTGLVSGGSLPYSFSWSFGDGASGQGQSVSHTYIAGGNYFASLTVTDGSSAQRSDYVVVLVSESTGSIAVRVRDEAGVGISGASVRSLVQPVGQAAFSSTANDLGIAAFGGLKPGTYTVEASSPGYLTGTVNVTLTSNQSANPLIVLRRPAAADYTFWLVGAVAVAVVAGVVLFWLRRPKRTAKARSQQ